MTIRSFVLAGVVTLCLARSIPAQFAAPPAVERTKSKVVEEEQPERLRQMQEDLTVFRVLFNRSTARYYNFPSGNSDKIHTPPMAEGVYLKSQGVIVTCGLPMPATHPLKKAATAAVENSAWQRTLAEIRGDKPIVERKPGDATKKSLSEVLLALLAENGHHFSKLADQERITIALTFRPTQECTRCHEIVMERRAAGSMTGMYSPSRLESPRAVRPPPTTASMGGSGAAPSGMGTGPRDDEQIDIQLGDLALKQGRFNEAESAYLRIIQRLGGKKGLEQDMRLLILLSELSSKLAQCELASGQGEKAKAALEMAQKYSQAAVKIAEQRGKTKTDSLPPQLILSATKAQLDQVAAHKINFEEFSKTATVEYRTFDAPASSEGKKDGMK